MDINDINGINPSKVPGSADDAKIKQTVDQPAAQQESGKPSTTDTVSLSDNAVQLGKLDIPPLQHRQLCSELIDVRRVSPQAARAPFRFQ